jgi:hypothetical protein
LPVLVTGAGPVLDYATDQTAFLIPAERRPLAGGRVGDIETIRRPWLFEPDAEVRVALLRRVASDRAGARAVGMAASAWVRERFTWGQSCGSARPWCTVFAVSRATPSAAGGGF